MSNLAGVTHGIGVEWEGEAYFFPMIVMLWNEVANSRLGELQVAMTYCPLTDTALLFDTGSTPMLCRGRATTRRPGSTTPTYRLECAGVRRT